MNAAYLVDNVALLSLQEKQDGVEFHCFDMDSKVQTGYPLHFPSFGPK